MGTWNSRGLRGSTLEDMVNRTNEWYLEKNLALMQKIPTPITPVRMDKEHRQITLAYFDQRSTIDYIGAVQGIPVCFDAKECVAETFPLQNIHEHQVEFMKNFEKQQGIADGREKEDRCRARSSAPPDTALVMRRPSFVAPLQCICPTHGEGAGLSKVR